MKSFLLLGFALMSAVVGGAGKVRLTEKYDDESVFKEDLYAEIEARREERKDKDAANLFIEITAKSNNADMIKALEEDDALNTDPKNDQPPPLTPPETGGKGKPAVAPVDPNAPSKEQIAAAAQEKGGSDPRAQFQAMSQREADRAPGGGGRLAQEGSGPGVKGPHSD